MELLLLFTVVPAYLVGRFFLQHDPGEKEPQSAVYSAVGFGIMAMVLAVLVGVGIEWLLTGEVQLEESTDTSSAEFFALTALHATVEELAKFIPIALYLYKRPFFNELTDGIIYFAIVGLTFGSVESLLFALGGGGIFVAIVRLVLGFFFHASLTSLVGYQLARAKVTHKSMGPVFGALFLASLLHFVYNIGAYKLVEEPVYIFLSAGTAIATNVLMFVTFNRAAQQDRARMAK